MAQVIRTLHLSDMQKEVLAKVKAAPNAQVAFEELAHEPDEVDDNIAAARDQLEDLGLLAILQDGIRVTTRGLEVMKDENLIDETGEFTEEGQEYAGRDRGKEPEDVAGGEPMGEPGPMGAEMGAGAGVPDMGGAPPMESFSLVAELNKRVSPPKNRILEGVVSDDLVKSIDEYLNNGK